MKCCLNLATFLLFHGLALVGRFLFLEPTNATSPVCKLIFRPRMVTNLVLAFLSRLVLVSRCIGSVLAVASLGELRVID